eukprot:364336-Chlamydomonas_euryale.AAC.1
MAPWPEHPAPAMHLQYIILTPPSSVWYMANSGKRRHRSRCTLSVESHCGLQLTAPWKPDFDVVGSSAGLNLTPKEDHQSCYTKHTWTAHCAWRSCRAPSLIGFAPFVVQLLNVAQAQHNVPVSCHREHTASPVLKQLPDMRTFIRADHTGHFGEGLRAIHQN